MTTVTSLAVVVAHDSSDDERRCMAARKSRDPVDAMHPLAVDHRDRASAVGDSAKAALGPNAYMK